MKFGFVIQKAHRLISVCYFFYLMIYLVKANFIYMDFTPIFEYIDENNKKQEERLEAQLSKIIRDELGDIKNSIANLSSQVKKYHEEMLVSGHRIDRLESWAAEVGKKVGVPIVF